MTGIRASRTAAGRAERRKRTHRLAQHFCFLGQGVVGGCGFLHDPSVLLGHLIYGTDGGVDSAQSRGLFLGGFCHFADQGADADHRTGDPRTLEFSGRTDRLPATAGGPSSGSGCWSPWPHWRSAGPGAHFGGDDGEPSTRVTAARRPDASAH